jgi:hypothetical protein
MIEDDNIKPELINSMSSVLSKKLLLTLLVEKFCATHGTQVFIAVLTKAYPWWYWC